MSTAVRDQVSDEEWELRVNLAACYRIIAMYGWDDLVFTHISARVPGSEDHFLLNAYGHLFEEMTASSLVKVDLSGEKVLESPNAVNPAGFVIHSAVHEARADVGCVLHTHTRSGIAVSAQKSGLLPLSQISLLPYATLAYHDYEGMSTDTAERQRLAASLGDKKVMFLRNHGILTCGATVGEAFMLMYYPERSCRTQIQVLASGQEYTLPPDEVCEAAAAQYEIFPHGKYEWPALLRMLDQQQPGYKD